MQWPLPVVRHIRAMPVQEWLLGAFFLCLLPVAYFAPTALPLLMFLFGLAALPWLRYLRPFLPVAGLTLAILLLGFLRSDFVTLIGHGAGVGDAYRRSTRYFQAPLAMWFTNWALICLAARTPPAAATRLLHLLGACVAALCLVQLCDCLGKLGIRNALNVRLFGGHRPEMVVVRASDFNAILSLLFWPMTAWFRSRQRLPLVILMLAAIVVAAVVVDTNAHILMLIVGGIALAVVRFWPVSWTARGLTGGQLFAGLAALSIVAFPVAIVAIVYNGTDGVAAHLPASWSARIDIWSYAVRRCLEKPLWGWGYESARLFEPYIPNHPHNMAIQAWLELGIPGVCLLAALWACIGWFAVPSSPSSAAPAAGLVALSPVAENRDERGSVQRLVAGYALAAIAAYFVLNMISYGLWRDWLYCLGALTCVVFLLIERSRAVPVTPEEEARG